MIKKDLQAKYQELLGEAPAEDLTNKQLEEAIAKAESEVKAIPKAEKAKKGRVTVGSLY